MQQQRRRSGQHDLERRPLPAIPVVQSLDDRGPTLHLLNLINNENGRGLTSRREVSCLLPLDLQPAGIGIHNIVRIDHVTGHVYMVQRLHEHGRLSRLAGPDYKLHQRIIRFPHPLGYHGNLMALKHVNLPPCFLNTQYTE